jgi:predicted ribosomally synthesized peptide with SipW-like signal peptide
MRIPGRKLAISILIAIAAIALAGTGALAYFHDTETSTNNTFTAGTLDLKLADNDENPTDGVSASWTMTNMAPGESAVWSHDVELSNSGTIAGDHVEITFTNEIDENEDIYPDLESETCDTNIAAEMAQWLEIVEISYYDVNFYSTPGHILIDTNGNSFLDLDDLADPLNATALDNLAVPPAGHGHTTLEMDVKFNSGAGNDFQGDTLTTTITFTLNQDASQ